MKVLDAKQKNFMNLKSVAAITFTIVLMLTFVSLLSYENSTIQIADIINTKGH